MSNYTKLRNDGADQSLVGNRPNNQMVNYPWMRVIAIRIFSSFCVFLGLMLILIQVSAAVKQM